MTFDFRDHIYVKYKYLHHIHSSLCSFVQRVSVLRTNDYFQLMPLCAFGDLMNFV